MTQLLAGRLLSQSLPSVKCSTCGRPVPVDELGDHSCQPRQRQQPPPPKSAAALLPPRLQNLAANSPISPSARSPVVQVSSPLRSAPVIQASPPHSHSPRPKSPLPPSQTPVSAAQQPHRPPQPQPQSQPQRDHRFERPTPPADASDLTRTRPTYDRNNASSPRPNEIDTKTGGEAGMAGVGRRGFAAAARAALFTAPQQQHNNQPPPTNHIPIPGMDGRRANAPMYLDISASRSAATPPLSPNSTSSHSHSPSPLSPQPQVNHNDKNNVASRSPSPSRNLRSEPKMVSARQHELLPPPVELLAPKTPETPPLSGSAALSARLPFFEKYKNKLPTTNTNHTPSQQPSPTPPPSNTVTNSPRSGRTIQFADEPRNLDPKSRRTPVPPPDNQKASPSPRLDPLQYSSSSSGSEVGLAYADSEYSDDEVAVVVPQKEVKKKSPPPPLDLPTQHPALQFPSQSQRKKAQGQGQGQTLKKASSSASSNSNSNADQRSAGMERNGSAVSTARALGRTPVEGQDVRVNGSPGGPSTAKKRSNSPTSTKSAYSVRSKSTISNNPALERTMEMIDDEDNLSSSLLQQLRPPLSPLAKSKSTSSASSGSGSNGLAIGIVKAQRANTVSSPDIKTPKLPGRSRAGPDDDDDGDGVGVRSARREDERSSERKKKKLCARCEITILDGRWVQMDGGKVLCEKCWKNMYLPKCRRCNLPIEKQAVSSSDGQLKGKYHRECFNCHSCHKPFPDKTFYVFDGKPLCAYHYHEANDSLCAASTCGQPIEGPCAVSHAGDRYHPHHFLCEHPGSLKCQEKLEEYWEVDGRMLCEQHAISARSEGSGSESDTWTPSARATKRVTRFIDLAGR